ncbi:hypothetical protein CYMTET_46371, partial [Cymbomonas tetramitiformis]
SVNQFYPLFETVRVHLSAKEEKANWLQDGVTEPASWWQFLAAPHKEEWRVSDDEEERALADVMQAIVLVSEVPAGVMPPRMLSVLKVKLDSAEVVERRKSRRFGCGNDCTCLVNSHRDDQESVTRVERALSNAATRHLAVCDPYVTKLVELKKENLAEFFAEASAVEGFKRLGAAAFRCFRQME